MPELGSFGSVRGVPGNGHSYREPGPIAEHKALAARASFNSVGKAIS